MTAPRVAVDLSPRALLAAGLAGVSLAADLDLAAAGRWTLATRAEDLGPEAVRISRPTPKSAIATVEVRGPIEQRATAGICGGMTDGYDAIEARFSRAVDLVQQAGSGKAVIDVDSPGGVTAAAFSTVRRMRAYAERAGVHVVSVASEQATSAGYALLLVGDERHVPPRGTTASIGVLSVRRQADDADKVEVFRSGPRKARPNSIEPLTKEDRAELQDRVDDGAIEFAEWVSERTGLSVDAILAHDGAAMTGTLALKHGLITGNLTAHEVIDMVTADQIRAEMAEATGLPPAASVAEIKARASEGAAALKALDTYKAQAASAEQARIALEAKTAREKAEAEATAARAKFAAEINAACSVDRVITPDTEAKLLAHYDAHGETSARATFTLVRAAQPIVTGSKPGAIPVPSDAAGGLTDFDKARAKQLNMTEAEYASFKLGKVA